MMGTILLIVVVGILVGLIVLMVVKSLKKTPTPTPTPSPQTPPRYLGFLQNIETAVRNNLSEEELKIFFQSIETEINDVYIKMDGFDKDFRALLLKYNIPYPY